MIVIRGNATPAWDPDCKSKVPWPSGLGTSKGGKPGVRGCSGGGGVHSGPPLTKPPATARACSRGRCCCRSSPNGGSRSGAAGCPSRCCISTCMMGRGGRTATPHARCRSIFLSCRSSCLSCRSSCLSCRNSCLSCQLQPPVPQLPQQGSGQEAGACRAMRRPRGKRCTPAPGTRLPRLNEKGHRFQ
eukprot:gene3950-biopygen15881